MALRYRKSQIKAAISVNQEKLLFNWFLGRDIVESNDPVVQQVVGLFQIPWGHHCLIMDNMNGDYEKALFFIRKTIENGWSRAVLLNWIQTDLYAREGKALSNFRAMLPEPLSNLAQEITDFIYSRGDIGEVEGLEGIR